MRKDRPYVMYTLFAINTIVFIMQYLLPGLSIENQLGMFAPSVICSISIGVLLHRCLSILV